MTSLPRREGGPFDWPAVPLLRLDSEAVWAALMAKLDLPSLPQREASGARGEA